MKKSISKALFLALTMVLILAAFSSCGGATNIISPKEYTISFDLNGGVGGDGFAESIVVAEGKTLTLSVPTREGYNFLGWYSGDTEITESTPITEDLALKAKWEFKSFKVSFLDYYGNTVSSQTVKYGESAVAPTVDSIIEKKRFDGWSADFSNITKDIIINALYVDNTYTISYELGEIGTSFEKPCFYGELPKIPETPVADGYIFCGWYLDEELTDRYFFDSMFDRDITLYAKFYDTSLGEYTVISNHEQFKAIKDDPTKKYLLACDINFKGEKITPINFFSGELEGNGYKLYNFLISETGNTAGIINTINETAVVKNLNISEFTYTITSTPSGNTFYGIFAVNKGVIENCNILEGEINISASNRGKIALLAGGICGYNFSGTITGCTNNATINLKVTHTVKGNAYINIGGIVGRNECDTCQVLNCVNYGQIKLHSVIGGEGIRELSAGGICGWNMGSNAKIDNCVNYKDVNNTVELLGTVQYPYSHTGGVVGKNAGIINNCYSEGNVTISEIDDYNFCYETYNYIGGFVGWNCGIVYNCYSKGNISAMPSLELYAGGFVGYNVQQSESSSTITKCFSIGNVEIIDDVAESTSVIYVGYFAGKNDLNVRDCYYLESITLTYKNVFDEGISKAIEATCTDGESKSIDELTSVDFIENTLYFDRTIWLVLKGKLPTLK